MSKPAKMLQINIPATQQAAPPSSLSQALRAAGAVLDALPPAGGNPGTNAPVSPRSPNTWKRELASKEALINKLFINSYTYIRKLSDYFKKLAL